MHAAQDKLQVMRNKIGMSVDELSERSGVAVEVIQSIENNRLSTNEPTQAQFAAMEIATRKLDAALHGYPYVDTLTDEPTKIRVALETVKLHVIAKTERCTNCDAPLDARQISVGESLSKGETVSLNCGRCLKRLDAAQGLILAPSEVIQ